MKTLIINSYAGSLLLAAEKTGLDLIGSYEDAGYGMRTQMLNFSSRVGPAPFRSKRSEWPEQIDLRDSLVVAHPPCAAFSVQNTKASARGVKTGKFACTIGVAEYAMRNKALALLIESVPPAMEGARSVHERLAEEHGYRIFRVLQNAVTFGLPQWRPRFWVVFTRRRGGPREMTFSLAPRWRSVGELMDESAPGPVPPSHERRFRDVLDKMRETGIPTRVVNEILRGEHGFGSIPQILNRACPFLGLPKHRISKVHCGRAYESWIPKVFDPETFGTTLMGDHMYYSQGRLFSLDEYKAYMGFPRKYRFQPEGQAMFLLSRGVCPPVAAWMMQSVVNNLESSRTPPRRKFFATLREGEVADFTIKKGEVPRR